MLWLQRVEKLAVAQSVGCENPPAAFSEMLDGFDAWLESDPAESGAAAVDRRIAELLEEAA